MALDKKNPGGRPNMYDRALQPQVRFRVDELTNKQLKKICKERNLTIQEVYEQFTRDFINSHLMAQ